MDFSCNVKFEKADTRGQYIRGWAYVAADEGGKVVDYCGDVLGGHTVDEGMTEVRKMAHDFICDFRTARMVHKGKAIGEVVESVVVDDAFAKELGIVSKRRGWWIGMRVDDPAVQKMVRDGKLRQFSIGGNGKRIPLAEAA